jgi:hypothetical protein
MHGYLHKFLSLREIYTSSLSFRERVRVRESK